MPTGIYPRTEKMKKNMRGHKGYWKGKHLSEEHKRNIGLIHKGNKYFLGYHHSEETKRKISLANSGENNGNWKGNKVGYAGL
jgi:hypothetical protein